MADAQAKAQKAHESTEFVVPVNRDPKTAAVSNQATKGEGFMRSPSGAVDAAQSNQFAVISEQAHD